MSTEASILTNSKTDELYVPVDAVHTANNQKYVNVTSANNSEGTHQKAVNGGQHVVEGVEINEPSSN